MHYFIPVSRLIVIVLHNIMQGLSKGVTTVFAHEPKKCQLFAISDVFYVQDIKLSVSSQNLLHLHDLLRILQFTSIYL